MKKFLIFCFVVASLQAKININEADRYELMTIGGLDAGRADMLMKYREKREITDASQFKNINGFGGYDTSKLVQNFDLATLPKPEPKVEEKPAQNNVIIINNEKTRIIHQPPRYRYEQNFGNGISIIEEGSVRHRPSHYEEHRYYQRRESRTTTSVDTNPSAKRVPVPMHMSTQTSKKSSSANNCRTENGICVNGEVRTRSRW